MAKSYYLDNAFLEAALRNVSYTSPATAYVALYTSAPGPTGGGTEVAGGSYQRTACTFGAPTNGALTNSGACTFPQATAGWGTITSFGIFDLASGGNLLYYGNLTASKTINSGDQLTFAISGITVTES
jgi:hypothetical protein